MRRPIMRFVTRLADAGDTLVIGSRARSGYGAGLLHGGRLYELNEMLGSMMLTDLGPHSRSVDWGKGLDHVVNEHDDHMFLTSAERRLKEAIQAEEKRRKR